MTPAELLHTEAARYANNRKNAYVEAMSSGKVDSLSDIELGRRWLAHYEGYREGYWIATGDNKFTTDPLKEKNT